MDFDKDKRHGKEIDTLLLQSSYFLIVYRLYLLNHLITYKRISFLCAEGELRQKDLWTVEGGVASTGHISPSARRKLMRL